MVKHQFGFKPKRSIEECRMYVLQTLHTLRMEKQSCYAVFFDIVSAYDNVNRSLL